MVTNNQQVMISFLVDGEMFNRGLVQVDKTLTSLVLL